MISVCQKPMLTGSPVVNSSDSAAQQTVVASAGLRRAGSGLHIVGEPLKAFYDQYKDEHEGEEPPPHIIRDAATRFHRERVRGGAADWKASRTFIQRWKECYLQDTPTDRQQEVSRLISLLVKSCLTRILLSLGQGSVVEDAAAHSRDGAAAEVGIRLPSLSAPQPRSLPGFNVQVSLADLCAGLQIRSSRKRPRPSSASDFVAVRACAAGQVEEIQGGEDGDGADEQDSQHGQPASASARPGKLRLLLHPNPPTLPHGGRHRPVRIFSWRRLSTHSFCVSSYIVDKASVYAPFLSVLDSNERGRVSSLRLVLI